jgi:hypothetical protein
MNAICRTAPTIFILQTAHGFIKKIASMLYRFFVPITINKGYMGYSWTKLPKVTKVEVKKKQRKASPFNQLQRNRLFRLSNYNGAHIRWQNVQFRC